MGSSTGKRSSIVAHNFMSEEHDTQKFGHFYACTDSVHQALPLSMFLLIEVLCLFLTMMMCDDGIIVLVTSISIQLMQQLAVHTAMDN